jgi:hypothetical protein
MLVNVPKLVQAEYHRRLNKAGIPADPAQRTPDQTKAATLTFWAVQNEFILGAEGLTQAGLEVK